MATHRPTTRSKTSSSSRPRTRAKSPASQSASQDAIAMLVADHRKVKELFKEFAKQKDDAEAEGDKASLVKQACQALTIHTHLEEEIFYPAVREAIDDGDLMDEALVEHAGAKELIAQLEDMQPGDDLYDAKVTVLSEQIAHHVEEEEGTMFPEAKRAKLDTAELGAQMQARKAELLAELGADAAEEGTADAPPRRSSPLAGARRERDTRAKH